MDDNKAAADQPQGLQAGCYREIGLRAVAAALLDTEYAELCASEPSAAADHET